VANIIFYLIRYKTMLYCLLHNVYVGKLMISGTAQTDRFKL